MCKEVEVYNTYFGDCIMLKEKSDNSNLLVDFGVHYSSKVSSKYGARVNLMCKIADDISMRYSGKKTSLLITHFHEDHISGLIYMHKSNQSKYKTLFRNIYIANIWNTPFVVASNIFEELLLEIEMKKCKLPRTTINLFDLLDFLCSSLSQVKLLSKGITFEDDKYITLWPADDNHHNKISEIIHDLRLPTYFEGKLLALSEIVCIYVKRELLVKEYNDEYLINKQRIEDMRNTYYSLLDDISNNIDEMEQDIDIPLRRLNKLNHEYNIVFQNKVDGTENVLFTGDIEASCMEVIANAKDIKLHNQFKYIKIPHHGTYKHYFDFSKYTPDNVIITNGQVHTKHSSSYKICTGYGKLKAVHLCTNSNNCCNCSNSCLFGNSICVQGRKLVYSNLYATI